MSVVLNSYTMLCPPVREIIHSLKLADYLVVQTDKAWYTYYVNEKAVSRNDTINKNIFFPNTERERKQ